jgi:hypothetical protein
MTPFYNASSTPSAQTPPSAWPVPASHSTQTPPPSSNVPHTNFPGCTPPSSKPLPTATSPATAAAPSPNESLTKWGGERENILRGLDPDLRVRLRAAGYRVVLVPNARIYHPLPNGWKALLRMFFRNGYGSAYAQKFQPECVYDTHELLDATAFQAKRSLSYRILRFPFRLAAALLRGHFLRFTAYTCYVLGYAWGWLTAKNIEV